MNPQDSKKRKMKFTRKEVRMAVAYGMGYVCGKHRLKVTRKELREVASEFLKHYDP